MIIEFEVDEQYDNLLLRAIASQTPISEETPSSGDVVLYLRGVLEGMVSQQRERERPAISRPKITRPRRSPSGA